jgi:hypothetical protein
MTTSTNLRLHPGVGVNVDDLSGISRTTIPPLREALLATPGWADAVRAVNEVCTYEAGLRVNRDLRQPLLEQLADEARAGSITTDFAKMAAENAATIAGRAALIEAATQVRTTLMDELNTLVHNNLDPIRRSLHTTLQALMAEVAEHTDDLRSVTTAEDAIATDTVAAYELSRSIPKRYAQIREAQRLLDTKALSQRPMRYTEVHRIANVLDVFPLAGFHGARVPLSDSNGNSVRLTEPWPNDDHGDLAFLLWAQQAGARLWVPTESELINASRTLLDAEAAARHANPGERLRLLKRHHNARRPHSPISA